MRKLSILLGILFFLFTIPIIIWFSTERENLEVVIIDKTVPDETYREHLGISWALNHLKMTKGKVKRDVDYFGFIPDEANESYEIRELPQSYDDVDIIYLADSYGVYEDDLPWLKVEGERDGKRSGKIYGGLEMAEWHAIYERMMSEKSSTLIMEFNAFASPTDIAVKDQIASYLDVNWSGWIGRYFHELDPNQNDEIPQWIFQYKNVDEWSYQGPGFILVNEYRDELLVLTEGEHVGKSGIRLKFTERGNEKFGLNASPKYQYWFDIIEANDPHNVLAYYNWDLTEEGRALLEENDIPAQFAGVIEQVKGQAKSYYFAGDYTDVDRVPILYQYSGFSKILSWFYKSEKSERSFFWNAYMPMIKVILSESTMSVTNDVEEKQRAFAKDGNISYNSRIENKQFEIYVDGKWEQVVIKGVNIGMGKPGVFPGEAAIKKDEYYRWFRQIQEMGANAVRIYTIHPPDFYDALKQFNDENEQKLYLFHGVWINEESMAETLDAFHPFHTEQFQNEMKTIVDIVHGNAVIEPQPGHASGIYRSDISEYVIGWIIGIEWYPYMVEATNETHSGIGQYDGRFVYTEGAEPFEIWLAEQMDTIVSYEFDEYEWIRPISFTNWVTTDILDHPAEPSESEDMVSVDPNVIYLKNEMQKVNQFASYHVYPYYPDFLNYEEKYVNYVDHRGEKNNYAAYLRDLHEAHDLPILIAEFGVPASRGLTHVNPFGWNQGFLSEEEQGDIIVRLFEDIMHEEMLGGLVFTWQDEWFKRTWNTMDYDNPDRRPFWSNAQTNEQQFGILSFDRHKIRVDGSSDDWQGNRPLYEGTEQLQSLYMDHDERYLYMRIDIKDSEKLGNASQLLLLFDTIPNQGNHFIRDIENFEIERGIDFLLSIKDEHDAAMYVDDYYDFFTYLYSHKLKLLDADRALPTNNSGKFSPIYFALNKEMTIPSTGKTYPFEKYETGKLLHGNGNPDAVDYNSLVDYSINRKMGIIEVRIPWLLLSFRDPSMREVMANLYDENEAEGTLIDGIYVCSLFVENERIVDSFPKLQNNKMKQNDLVQYEWDTWNEPLSEERLKKSYYMIQKAFQQY